MLTSLFKPKWQSKNPSVRLKAIAGLSGTSEELIQLATSDPDTDVRLGALQQLQCIKTLSSIAQNSAGILPNQAKKRIAELAVKTDIDGSALSSAYQLIDDINVHSQIALDVAKPLSVRKQAIQQLDDQEIFFKLASQDSSKEIQFLAAKKITRYDHIKQLQKQTKNNKKLRQLLKQRSEQQEALEKELTQLEAYCKELDQLGRGDSNKWEQDKTKQLVIEQHWRHVTTDMPQNLSERYQTNLANYNKRLSEYEAEQQKLQPLQEKYQIIISHLSDITVQLDNVLSADTEALQNQRQQLQIEWEALSTQIPASELADMQSAITKSLTSFDQHYKSYQQSHRQINRFQILQQKAESLFNASKTLQEKDISSLTKQWQKLKAPMGVDIADISEKFHACINRLQAKLKQQDKQLNDKYNKLLQLVESMEKHVTNDKLSQAIRSHQSATKLLRTQPKLPAHQYRAIQQRINKVSPTIRSAQDWRHWGTDKAREDLINQAQALISNQEIQPLDRAKAIKDLRNKWQKLGKMDPSKHQKLWGKFDSACSKAYEPCQQFYQDESKQRKSNLAQRQAICDELVQLEQSTDWKTVDWKVVTKQINQVRNRWKKAGSVDRNDWKTINQTFNEAMDALEVHMDNERRINWARRKNLVQQAQALAASDDELAELIEQAKALQGQWQPTVTSKRSEEQKLWNAFRKELDAVFERKRNEHDASRQAFKQNQEQLQGVVEKLKSLTKLANNELIQSAHQISQLEDEFNQTSGNTAKSKNKKLDTEFYQIKEKLIEKLAQAKNQQIIEQIKLLAQKAQLCSRKELGETIDQEWVSLASLDDSKLESMITERYKSNDISPEQQADNLAKLLKLTLEIEIHLALETPEAYQSDRIQWQVDQMANQMLSASDTQPPKDEIALNKIKDWYCTGKIEDSEREVLEQRFLQVEQWLENYS